MKKNKRIAMNSELTILYTKVTQYGTPTMFISNTRVEKLSIHTVDLFMVCAHSVVFYSPISNFVRLCGVQS